MKHLKLCLMIIAMPHSLTACMTGLKTEFKQAILYTIPPTFLALKGHKQFNDGNAVWNPDNSILVSITDNEIIIRDGQTGEPKVKNSIKDIHDVIFSPDGTRLLFKAFGSPTENTAIYLCDGHTGQCINAFATKFTATTSFTCDSRTIIISSNHKFKSQRLPTLYYDAISGNPIETLSLKKNIIEFTHDNCFRIIGNTLHDAQTLKPIMTLPAIQQSSLLALSPDNNSIAANINGTLVLYKLFSDHILHILKNMQPNIQTLNIIQEISASCANNHNRVH